jgi:hypothetical protein
MADALDKWGLLFGIWLVLMNTLRVNQ